MASRDLKYKFFLQRDGKPFYKNNEVRLDKLYTAFKVASKQQAKIEALISIEDDCVYTFEDDGTIQDLPSGDYLVTIEIVPVEPVLISAEEICISHECLLALNDKSTTPIQAIQRVPFAFEKVAVSRQESHISYLIATTSTCVYVAIDCSKEFPSLLRSFSLSSLSSHQGQVHAEALRLADTLPFNTLMHMCTIDTITDATNPQNSTKDAQTKVSEIRKIKNLIYCGCSLSGSVAHIAALKARSNVRDSNFNMEVKAVSFSAPYFGTKNFVNGVLEKETLYHLNICAENDHRLHYLVNLLILSANGNVSLAGQEYLDTICKLITSSDLDKINIGNLKSDFLDEVLRDIESPLSPFGVHAFVGSGSRDPEYLPPSEAIDKIQKSSRFSLDLIPWHSKFEKGLAEIPSEILDLNSKQKKNPQTIQNLEMKPTITECQIVETPTKIEVIIMGMWVEPIIGRSGIATTNVHAIDLDSLVTYRESTTSSLEQMGLFSKISSEEDEKIPKVIVLRSSRTETRLLILHGQLVPNPLLVVNTDFGTSDSFKISAESLIKGSDPNLLELLNSGISLKFLEGCFLRGILHRKSKIPTPFLELLVGLEKIVLEDISKAEIPKIIETYMDRNISLLKYSRKPLSSALQKITRKISKQLKLRTKGIPLILRRAASILGYFVGGVISVVGGIAAMPGLLLALPGMLMIDIEKDSFAAGMIVSAPGALAALPGALIAGIGVAIIMASKVELEEEHNYRSSLKLLLRLLDGNPGLILDEIPYLEDAISRQFEKITEGQQLDEADSAAVQHTMEKILSQHQQNEQHHIHVYKLMKNKEDIWERLRIVGKLNQVRKFLVTNLVLAIVGVHNAGKSTFVNKLFGIDTKPDALTRTEVATLYRLKDYCGEKSSTTETTSTAITTTTTTTTTTTVTDSIEDRAPSATIFPKNKLFIDIIDFPGASDEREAIAEVTSHLAPVATFFFCIFSAGHIAGPEKGVMDIVKAHEKPYLVFINKMENLDDLEQKKEVYRVDYAGRLGIDPKFIIFTSLRSTEEVEKIRLWLFHNIRRIISQEYWPELAWLLLHPDMQKFAIPLGNSMSVEDVKSVVCRLMLEQNQMISQKDFVKGFSQEKIKKESQKKAQALDPTLLKSNKEYNQILEVLTTSHDPNLASVVLNAGWNHMENVMRQYSSEKSEENPGVQSEGKSEEKSGERSKDFFENSFKVILKVVLLDKILITQFMVLSGVGNTLSIPQKEILPAIHTLCSDSEIFFQSAHLANDHKDPIPINIPQATNITLNDIIEKCTDIVLKMKANILEEKTASDDEEDSSGVITNLIAGSDAILLLKTVSEFSLVEQFTSLHDYGGKFSGKITPNTTLEERLEIFKQEISSERIDESAVIPINDVSPYSFLGILAEIDPSKLKKRIQLKLEGSPAIDLNGVLKSVTTEFSSFVRKNQLFFLKSNENGHVYLNPAAQVLCEENGKEKYVLQLLLRGLGRLIGISICQKITIPIPFTTAFFKLLLGHTVDFSDLEIIDSNIYTSIKEIATLAPNEVKNLYLSFSWNVQIPSDSPITNFQGPEQIIDPRHVHPLKLESKVYHGAFKCDVCQGDGFGQVYHCATCNFDIHTQCILEEKTSEKMSEKTTEDRSGKVVSVELKNGGLSEIVTATNRVHYLELLVKYFLGKNLPLKFLLLGAQDVCPRELLAIFTPAMLQILVCGVTLIDVEEIINNTVCFLENQMQNWFFNCLRSMSPSDMALFLTFVTGTSVLPVGGAAQLNPPLSVRKSFKTENFLPITHTCFNSLELPEYTSYEQLNNKLLFAIRSTGATDFGSA